MKSGIRKSNRWGALLLSIVTLMTACAQGLPVVAENATGSDNGTARIGASVAAVAADAVTTTGDINGDGVINGKDIVRFTKYLSGEDVVVEPLALDTNGDGRINGKDMTRLKKYLAGSDELAPLPEPEPRRCDGVVISKVFGTGEKADASADRSFVELYNTGDAPVSLAGASLYYRRVDGVDNYTEFRFPSGAEIPAGGTYLVRGRATRSYLTANQVLCVDAYDCEWDIAFDNKEACLLLAESKRKMDPATPTADEDACSVFVASLTPSLSVCAIDNLSKNKVAVRTALTDYSGYHTVNLAKSTLEDLQPYCPTTSSGVRCTLVGSRLNQVIFSHPAGVYESAFYLKLSAREGYTIYYTLDGSDPVANGKEYGSGIRILNSSNKRWGPTIEAWNSYQANAKPGSETMPGGTVVKAYATNGTTSTPVYTSTYFVSKELASYQTTIMSMSINVSEMIGPNGFYSNYNPTGNLSATRPRGMAMMEVFNKEGTRVGYSNVEVAVHGNGSSGFNMKSLRLYYKSANNLGGGTRSNLDYDLFDGTAVDAYGQAITTFDRLILRNSGNDCGISYIRDAFMQRMASELEVDTQAYAPVLLFVNGEFWGVYNARERYSAEYVADHYGVNKNNVAIVESDYSQVHSNWMAPYVLSDGVAGDEVPFNNLINYVQSHSMAVDANYAYVCTQLDVDSLIDMYVARLFFNARDWPENNVKVWRNKDANDPSGVDTKWHFVLLDMDMGLSYLDFTTERDNLLNNSFATNTVLGRLMNSLMQNTLFKNRFLVRYYTVVTQMWTAEHLNEVLDAMIPARDLLMPLQAQRWPGDGASVSRWNSQKAVLRSFINNRTSHALSSFYGFFVTSAEQIEGLATGRVAVSVMHPQKGVSLAVDGATATHGKTVLLQDETTTFQVTATPEEGYEVTALLYTTSQGTSVRIKGACGSFTAGNGGTLTVAVRKKTTSAAGTVLKSGLTAGAQSLYYLTEEGDLYAWGNNLHGVLGLGTSASSVATPTYVRGGVAKVATNEGINAEQGNTDWMMALLTFDGQVLTVGVNASGQLGRNGTVNAMTLAPIGFTGKVKDISVGHDHLLILDENNVLWGVGSNTYGQLGTTGCGSYVTEFVQVAKDVAFMCAGRRNTAYVDRQGQLFALGDNRWNKIDRSGVTYYNTPQKMGDNMVFLDAGEHQFLAVTETGELYYAGWRTWNGFQQGDGNNPVMTRVMTGVRAADILFGNLVILTTTGDAYSYGLNTGEALGATITSGAPQKRLSGVKSLAAGYGFVAYEMEDGRILVCGDNGSGVAGNGTTGGIASLTEAAL